MDTDQQPEDNPSQVGREPSSDPDLISIQLQRARQDAGLSVQELSRQTGISKTVLHGYERGRTKPGAREIRLLSAALNISPNRLILGSDDFHSQRPTFTSLFRKVKARPQLAGMILVMYLPLITPLFDEDELASLLTLLVALVRSRDPGSAEHMVIAAEEVAIAVDGHTLVDGSRTITEDELMALIASVQAKVADRVSRLTPNTQ
ncbi:helix-turn-helix transcriptional regulator [Hydrogenophaga sp.]|uniref:helix-turn-helix domain-containing protein n=1 Tax=Hydrogenophaga sp. TaxID=1904254 RepID=UPI0025B7FB10|nr:helix-turn-helix transcriptional regulator [Hydrogenophaga sp.]MBT9466779.1 helix-turn-helix transcriptional regulator [Hydrogenophaga sp.]